MPYYYYKAVSMPQSSHKQWWKQAKYKINRAIPNALITVGALAVLAVAYPMFSYQLTSYKWQQRKVLSPLDNEQADYIKQQAKQIKGINANGLVQAVAEPESTPEVIDGIDYTKVENWFEGANLSNENKTTTNSIVSTYSISIPKLNIKDMIVEIGGTDLDKHLIHYAGTAIPGQYGNPVIFGHSVLPVFYNPKSYISVFSKLPTLEEGDEIYVNYDGIKYRYVVESYHEVKPSQVEVLEQRYDRQTITLITCVPPGTYTRRGVIMGVLEK